ncbi:diaminopropionate ammonia-lyase [Fusarium beomiforme]|uniref:Diaminopropionate ammonia-lyase n=1 Tax=Fusarium beomiforme TaxID=44412 RepID=A0A9P5DXX0_9HYPO|nr:diaminopropionate ammonia-lyase [Fusarium beomiforme]
MSIYLRASSYSSLQTPGNTARVAAAIRNYLKQKGILYQLVDPLGDGRVSLISDFQGGKGPSPRVVLNGHIDTLPVGDYEGWSRSPWSGAATTGGRIHGRGSAGMKSGTASLVIVYASLYERRDHLSGSVALCAVAEGETGGEWGTRFLLKQSMARWGGNLMLSADPGGLEIIGHADKGTLRLKCAIRKATAFINDIIMDLETLGGYIPFGLGSDMAGHFRTPEAERLIDKAMGPGASETIFGPTINVSTIVGGLKVDMIPEVCTFELDIRMPLWMEAEWIMQRINLTKSKHEPANIKIEVQDAASYPASHSAMDHLIVGLLRDNAKSLCPSVDAPIPVPSMGTSECRHYQYAGIPAYSYGCSPRTSESFMLNTRRSD